MFRPLLLATTLCLVAAPSWAQPAPAPQDDTPTDVEDSVKMFVYSLNRDNVYFNAIKYVSAPRDYGYFGGPAWAKMWVEKRGDLKLKVDQVQVSNVTKITASARVIYHWTSTQPRLRSESITENLKLQLGQPVSGQEKTWQIVPTAPSAPEVRPDGLVVVPETPPVLNAVAYALADPQVAYGAELATDTKNNLKQVSLAGLQFLQDYDLKFAFNQDSLVEALTPYVGNKDVFTVPATKEIYSFNENLAGKLGNIHLENMHQVVVFYEGRNLSPVFRYDGKAAIAFADGHVKLVTREEAKDLIWEPVWKK